MQYRFFFCHKCDVNLKGQHNPPIPKAKGHKCSYTLKHEKDTFKYRGRQLEFYNETPRNKTCLNPMNCNQ